MREQVTGAPGWRIAQGWRAVSIWNEDGKYNIHHPGVHDVRGVSPDFLEDFAAVERFIGTADQQFKQAEPYR